MKKQIISIAVLLVAALFVTGCNTIEGVGKDLQKAGGAISGAAKQDEKKEEKR